MFLFPGGRSGADEDCAGRGALSLTDEAAATEIGYVEAIERHLGARRGREHVLSPRDFALARTWHRAAIPLATVLAGIDRAFDSGASVSSLAFCKRQVEELFTAGSSRTQP